MMVDLYKYENELYEQGLTYICGVDEVGRGPLYGPVVVASVVLPRGFILEGLTDSKKLSEKKRIAYNDYILEHAVAVKIIEVTVDEIDRLNIYQATKMGMFKAIEEIDCTIEHVLVDAMPMPELLIPNTSIIKGDSKSISIAAASVVAKVYRDNLMLEAAKEFPEYGFEKHKGYPTKAHIEALNKFGVLKEHRRSFAPVREQLNEQLKLF